MKISFRHVALFAFCLFVMDVVGQPTWQWGQTLWRTVDHLATDNQGNLYVAWSWEYSYELDGEVYTSHGAHDAAISSFDCNGNHRWTKIIGGASSDSEIAVGTDTLGGVYWVGNVNKNLYETEVVHIGTDTAVVPNRKALLFVKFDTDGNYQWHRMPEDTVVIDPLNPLVGVAVDMDVSPDGDCFIYAKLPPGTYADGAFEATYYGTLNFGEDVYSLRYDRDGNFTEGVHFDLYYAGMLFNNSEFTRDHQSGRYYLSGLNRVGDTLTLGETAITHNGGYISSFDQMGEVDWVRTASVETEGEGYITAQPNGKHVFDAEGNVYAAANVVNGSSFGDHTFYNPIDGNTHAAIPALLKFSPEGELLNAINAGVSHESRCNGVTLFDNTAAVTGSFAFKLIWEDLNANNTFGYHNVFLTRFNADTFEPISLDTLVSSPLSVEHTNRMVSDPDGNLYIGGRFEGVLYVADDTLYNQTGPFEGFVAKFGSDVCPCVPPEAAFAHDTLPGEDGYAFAYTGSAEADSILWDFGDGHTGSGPNPHHLFAEDGVYTVCVTVYNPCGEDTHCAEVAAFGPDAVQGMAGHASVKVYPNPAHATLSIAHTSAGARVEVVNALGNRVLTTSTASEAETLQIDIGALPPGVYLLILTDSSGKRGQTRFVKR